MSLEKPLVTVRRDRHSGNIEVDLVWPGEYKTMLTFVDEDFSNGEAEKTIEKHVAMVKRRIDLVWFKELAMKLELHKAEAEIDRIKHAYIRRGLDNKKLKDMTGYEHDKDQPKP